MQETCAEQGRACKGPEAGAGLACSWKHWGHLGPLSEPEETDKEVRSEGAQLAHPRDHALSQRTVSASRKGVKGEAGETTVKAKALSEQAGQKGTGFIAKGSRWGAAGGRAWGDVVWFSPDLYLLASSLNVEMLLGQVEIFKVYHASSFSFTVNQEPRHVGALWVSLHLRRLWEGAMGSSSPSARMPLSRPLPHSWGPPWLTKFTSSQSHPLAEL